MKRPKAILNTSLGIIECAARADFVPLPTTSSINFAAGQTVANPPHGFRMESGDELVVLAYELGQMSPVIKEKVVQEGADHSKDVSPILGGVPSVSEGRG